MVARAVPLDDVLAAGRTSDFSLPISTRTQAAARAAGGTVRTGVLDAPRSFELLGLTWSGRGEPDVQLRARRRGGRWSRWVDAPGIGEHAPDGEPPPRGVQPVWTGRADQFQLRMSRSVGGLRAHFVAGTRSGTRASAAQAVPEGSDPVLGLEPPAIIPRSGWATGSVASPRSAPAFGRVDLGFVHHTVSANVYRPDESAGIVRGIAHYHRNVLGWNDVGYNFLVDRYGQLFEGRAGGIDQAVIGAQAQGYNAFSTGISVIGTHSSVAASPEVIESVAGLLAWKLSLHGVPVEGTVTVTSGGGSMNRYPSGRKVSLSRISGHRDGDSTACPGNALYAQLPEIRRRAAQIAPSLSGRLTASLETPRTSFREEAVIAGALRLTDGRSPAERPLEIQYRSSTGSWRRLASTTTGADGSFRTPIRSAYTRDVRARFPGFPGVPAISSAPVGLQVRSTVTARLDSSRIGRGRSAVIRGEMRPRVNRRMTVIVDRSSKGTYVRSAKVRGAIRRGRYSQKVRLTRPGLYRLTVRTHSDKRNVAARSESVYVRVDR
ncbi:MAG: N-acetylmuramoyl-L-alanine amidase [Solirubrobacterales bacterium]